MSESGFAIRGNRHLIYTLFAKKVASRLGYIISIQK
jgi:hypothetical protein